MEFRHEWSSSISHADLMTLEHRLSTLMRPEIYSSSGYYHVHDLVFAEKEQHLGAVREKTYREIWRMRYYNDDLRLIRLKKVMQYNGISTKESCEVTRAFAQTILNRSFSDIVRDPMGRTGEDMDPLLQEFYWKIIGNGLYPERLLHFERKSYQYAFGNVRISIDCNMRSDKNVIRFLTAGSSHELAFDNRVTLHVKWDNYLPDVIRNAVTLEEQRMYAY